MVQMGQQFSRINKDPAADVAVTRMRNIYDATDDHVREAGKNWYANVHEAARKGLADNRAPGRTIHHAAGVIAAVSPNMDWEKNNISAFDEISNMSSRQWDSVRRSAAGGQRTPETADALRGLSVSSASDSALMKAHRIWVGGEDMDSVLNRRTAPKTNSFAHNIAEPHKAGHVTVDGRHSDVIVDAMRPWTESRGVSSAVNKTGSRTRYENYEQHTRDAAAHVGLLPHEMQAIVWEGAKPVERGFVPGRKKADPRIGQSYQKRVSQRLENFQHALF